MSNKKLPTSENKKWRNKDNRLAEALMDIMAVRWKHEEQDNNREKSLKNSERN